MRKFKWCTPSDLSQIIAQQSSEKNASIPQFDSPVMSMDLRAVVEVDRPKATLKEVCRETGGCVDGGMKEQTLAMAAKGFQQLRRPARCHMFLKAVTKIMPWSGALLPQRRKWLSHQ